MRAGRAIARSVAGTIRRVAAAGCALGLAASATIAQTPATPPCEQGGRYADFDFWVGEWDVFSPDGVQAGTNRIEKAQRGCVLVEHWTGAGGGTGTSFNHWHPGAARWVQLWVSGGGTIIDIEGGLRGDAMILAGTLINPHGESQPFRGTWTPNPDGSVRQLFEISPDGGRSWTTWFDGRYVRRR